MIEIIQTNDAAAAEPPPRSLPVSLWRGYCQKCPACGTGDLFYKYLKVADRCPACAEELHHHRADDAPPYFTILVVGHIVGAGILALELAYKPDTWIHYVIWLPLLILMSLWFLPRVKGTLIGLQWALRMHGFGGDEPVAEPEPGFEPGLVSRIEKV